MLWITLYGVAAGAASILVGSLIRFGMDDL